MRGHSCCGSGPVVEASLPAKPSVARRPFEGEHAPTETVPDARCAYMKGASRSGSANAPAPSSAIAARAASSSRAA